MGLKNGDLRDLVNPVFEIDNFKSKMGDDEDICVISFSVKEANAANDLVEFIEKSYDFVLDADSTASELDNGIHKVFVEIERNNSVNDNIVEMIYGVGELTANESFKFRYYKNFRSYDANIGNLQEMVPIDARTYSLTVVENAETFFSNLPGKVDFIGENVIVKKVYADALQFAIKDFDKTEHIKIEEKINIDAYPEILFLTKYLGDYNVTKYGDKTLTLENNGHTLVVERL
jgi:hypothetical protein